MITISLPYYVTAQEMFNDKLFPREKTWSVDCKIYRLTDKYVILLFPGQEKPSEVLRTSVKKIVYEDNKEVYFNEFGQIEAEMVVPMRARVKEVKNLGRLTLEDGQDVILNGIDFTLPSDSLELALFLQGNDYVRRMLKGSEVLLQFDKKKRDEFGRLSAYVIMPDAKHLNMELIKRGYCKVDRKVKLIYLEDMIYIEDQAKKNKVGIWNK